MNVFENGGKRFEMTVSSGKSYRLRLLNAAIQSTFMFYVDQHELEVIAMDFVPITPYTTNMVAINIGQRYDVILKANQPSGNYWLRSDNQQPCGNLTNSLDIKGIVHYADAPEAEPTSQAYGYAPSCLDEPLDKLVPIVPWDAGASDTAINEAAVIGPYPGTNLFKWTLSGTTFYAEWDNPTLKSIYEDNTVPDTSGNLAIQVPNLHEWVYVIISTPIPLPHPIHLHGHDFLILAQGLGAYSSAVPLNLKNPPRRDVAVIPADPTRGQAGYLVLAFYTSNPGVWLLHCHIGWVSCFHIKNLYEHQLTIRSTTLWASVFRSSRTSRALPTPSSMAARSKIPARPGPITRTRTTSSPPTLVSKRSVLRCIRQKFLIMQCPASCPLVLRREGEICSQCLYPGNLSLAPDNLMQ
jgi:FtsP/CotA-like multicopper oxidase with cupredoxin domain